MSEMVKDVVAQPQSRKELAKVECSLDACYSVVADVASYEKFLPFCKESVVVSNDGINMRAFLTAGLGPARHKYESYVTLDPIKNEFIIAQAPKNDRVFEKMRTVWRFEKISDSRTRVYMNTDFVLRSTAMAVPIHQHLELVTGAHISAFTKRMEKMASLRMSTKDAISWVNDAEVVTQGSSFKSKDDLIEELENDDCRLQVDELTGRVVRKVRVARLEVLKNGKRLREVKQTLRNTDRRRDSPYVSEKLKKNESFFVGGVRALSEELNLNIADESRIEFLDHSRIVSNDKSSFDFVPSEYEMYTGRIVLNDDEDVDLIQVENDLTTEWEWST